MDTHSPIDMISDVQKQTLYLQEHASRSREYYAKNIVTIREKNRIKQWEKAHPGVPVPPHRETLRKVLDKLGYNTVAIHSAVRDSRTNPEPYYKLIASHPL